jgi:FAD/FMN-containing dehydrogenase
VAEVEARLRAAGLTLGSQPPSVLVGDVGSWIEGRFGGRRVEAGRLASAVAGLEAVLPDGSVHRMRPMTRTAAGPNLASLILGAEGRIARLASAWLKAERLRPIERRAYRGAACLELARRTIGAHPPPYEIELHAADSIVLELAAEGEVGGVLLRRLDAAARALGLRREEAPPPLRLGPGERDLPVDELDAAVVGGGVRLVRIARERVVAVGGNAAAPGSQSEELELLGRIGAALRSES